MDDALSEITYAAQLAGLGYSIANQTTGLYVGVSGYNDKLPLLLDTVLTTIKNLEVKPERFKVMAEQVSSKKVIWNSYLHRYMLAGKIVQEFLFWATFKPFRPFRFHDVTRHLMVSRTEVRRAPS